MKIRIKGNSIRYRLTRPEVEQFAQEGYLEDSTDFGATRLVYSLQKTSCGDLSASFENNIVTIYMPLYMVNEWVTSERVGFSNTVACPSILIEKDFMCLDIAPEDQTDNYPNPLMTVA